MAVKIGTTDSVVDVSWMTLIESNIVPRWTQMELDSEKDMVGWR